MPNLGSVSYAPGPVPSDPKAIPDYLRMEFMKLQGAVARLAAGHIDMTYAAPLRPRDGDIRLADGTEWNPGSGAGFYGYYSGSWKKLG